MQLVPVFRGLFGIRAIHGAQYPWVTDAAKSVPLITRGLPEFSAFVHRFESIHLESHLKLGTQPGAAVGRSGSLILQLGPYIPGDK